MIPAAASLAAGGAGARAAPSAAPAPYPPTLAERHIARRDSARAWLAARGMAPQREQSDCPTALPRWRVPGWTSLFDDFDVMALAERRGWDG